LGGCALNEFPFDCILKKVEFYFNPADECVYGFTPEQLALNKKCAEGQGDVPQHDPFSDVIVWNINNVFIEGRLQQTVREMKQGNNILRTKKRRE
jgi:hypothetical protein